MNTITNPEACTWHGYRFTVHDVDVSWRSVGGIYIMASRIDAYTWRAHYVGQTNDFSTRLLGHERWPAARRAGATHVHAMVVSSEIERLMIEHELIGALQPALNQQLR